MCVGGIITTITVKVKKKKKFKVYVTEKQLLKIGKETKIILKTAYYFPWDSTMVKKI